MNCCQNASILLLDEVWNAYNTPSHLCTSGSKRALPSKSAVKKLESAFLNHPILGQNRSTEIQQLLQALHSAYCQFIGLSVSQNSSSSLETFAALPEPSTSWSPLHMDSPPTTSNQGVLTSLRLSQNTHVVFFRDWLIEIAKVFIEPSLSHQNNYTSEQSRVLEDPDSSCPFRELAPSRRQVSGPDGPFAHCSREAAFSALLFRGILFNTGALHESGHSGFFESFEAWSQFKAQYIHRGEQFICNPCAYGVTKGCTSMNDKQFWIASNILHEKLMEPDVSFTSIWKFIAYGKDDKKKKLFPSFGDLSAYLLTVDFTYAYRVPWPSLDEVANAVAVLHKGALHGLQKMHLVSTDYFQTEDVEESFKMLYHFLENDEKFAAVKGIAVFDFFMVEHALCKFSKDRVYEKSMV
ncbi:hypothetical protein HHX47_DHR1000867 [Lentinula edodes]|nr:hypothetical protein HHX47_DHR1000867 [Lentinula edodes]